MSATTIATEFGLLKSSVPKEMVLPLKSAIYDFHKSCGIDKHAYFDGFLEQTLQKIVQATTTPSANDFWVALFDDQLVGYCLGHLTTEIDNRMTYWLSQAWVRKDFRGRPEVKEWKSRLEKRAKELLCSHIVIVSSRSTGPYLRFLGDGWEHYASLLKRSI